MIVFTDILSPWFFNIYKATQKISLFTYIYYQLFLLNQKQKWQMFLTHDITTLVKLNSKIISFVIPSYPNVTLFLCVTRSHIAWHCKYFCHAFGITSVKIISYINQINPQCRALFPFLNQISVHTGFALYICFMSLNHSLHQNQRNFLSLLNSLWKKCS